MPLKRSVFRTRSLTAAVFAGIMLAGLLINQWTFFLLFTVIHFGCWAEYQRLIARIDGEYRQISPFHRYGVMIAGWCFMLYFTGSQFHLGDFSLSSVGWWLGLLLAFLLPVTELLFTSNISPKNIAYSSLGLLYISLSCGLMIDLMPYPSIPFRHLPVFPLAIIGCMWINDTMAYIVGSLIGKTQLSRISPNKTWEGTVGGIVLCVAAVTALGIYTPVMNNIAAIHWALIAAIAAITGTLGDLFESRLKRMASVKDSGRLMPGHGGMLDRFDSLLVATPFVWLYITLVLR